MKKNNSDFIENSVATYDGLPELADFDKILSLADHVDKECISALESGEQTRFTKALTEIVPGAFSILFSIRELIRIGFLFSAEILIRTLLERVAVICYLRKNGEEGLDLWEEGWPHKSRPSIKYMISLLDEPPQTPSTPSNSDDISIVNTLKQQIDHLNRVIHADPLGAYRNAFVVPDSSDVLIPSGPSFHNTEYCKEVSLLGLGIATVFIWELGKAIPDIMPKSAGI